MALLPSSEYGSAVEEQMMKKRRMGLGLGLVMVALGLGGCQVQLPGGLPATAPSAAAKNRVPIISAFDYSPKSGISKTDFVTFTLVANDPEGEALQYNWTATKGMLTANAGSTAAWRPTKTDGAIDPGLATVSVIVSDGTMTTTASVNIQISPTGDATVGSVAFPK
jgi:hypothetical protein